MIYLLLACIVGIVASWVIAFVWIFGAKRLNTPRMPITDEEVERRR